MTDYKSLKLMASSSPHIRAEVNTRSIMLDVIIALCPALLMSVYNFGNWNLRALTMTAVSVVSCAAWEWLYRALMKKPQMAGDLSAVVTGMLLAFVCPVTVPYWYLALGAFFAIVVVKQLYGGIGCNFLNPALAGRAALLASFAGDMTTWAAADAAIPVFGSTADVVTAATPMAVLKGGTAEAFDLLVKGDAVAEIPGVSLSDMFLGRIGGSLGETSALMLLLGGLYLLGRKIISWHIPATYIATVAVISLVAAPAGVSSVDYMLYSVLGGGLLLGAIFMATDYATSPVTKTGQVIFGVGCGLLTCFIRRFGSYPEGVCYSILIMNCTTWLLDKYIRPVIYGAPKKEKKEAAVK